MAQIIPSNINYIGAFKLGLDNQTVAGVGDNFDSIRGAIAYNPTNNSLFITGSSFPANIQGQKICEIPIPALVGGTSLAALSAVFRANAIQPFVDPVNGQANKILVPNGYDTQGNFIRGMHVVGNDLLINYDGFYTAGQQQYSVFKRPKNLSINTGIVGPARITDLPRMASGAFSDVPTAVQLAHGIAPVVVTQPLGSIQTELSWGKPLAAFNPADIANSTAISKQVLLQFNRVGFTNAGTEPRLVDPSFTVETANDQYTLATKILGVVWPDGYDSVLVFAYHGEGPYWYGAGDGSHPSGQVDPQNNSTQNSTHAPPYNLRCWVYNAQKLIDSKNGVIAPDSFLPDLFFNLADPFEEFNSYDANGSVTYDRANRIVYILRAGQNTTPGITDTGVVLAFQLDNPAVVVGPSVQGPLPTATVGQPYSATLTTVGSPTAITVASPLWLSIAYVSGNWVLSGTPPVGSQGTPTVSFSMTNASSSIPVTRTLPLIVAAAPVVGAIGAMGPYMLVSGGAVTYTVPAANVTGLSLSGAPAWVALTAAGLQMSPPAGTTGSFPFTLVGASGGSPVSQNVQVVVGTLEGNLVRLRRGARSIVTRLFRIV